ncbi:hypothetical protein [Azospirillum sp. SYSU D00513]|uniref:hypothetical protein n=1 Tax=Azospirillum sp. SYSU D00513 TaxID=2812561 RepID=UPI001A971420|nr:hypothetical protein [Azospirillum sp. SYSU D00513]
MFEKKSRATVLALGALLMLSACGSRHMRDAAEPVAMTRPAENKATLVIMRPSMAEAAIQSSVFDITTGQSEFIGIVSAGRKLAYEAPAGKRRLMVIGESADFLDADFTAGHTYFARVSPRLGTWKSRFALEPVPASSPNLKDDLRTTAWVENTPASHDWARTHMRSVDAKKAKYLPGWQAGSERKPFIAPESGRKTGL